MKRMKKYHAIMMLGKVCRTVTYYSRSRKGSADNISDLKWYYRDAYKEPWNPSIKILEINLVK